MRQDRKSELNDATKEFLSFWLNEYGKMKAIKSDEKMYFGGIIKTIKPRNTSKMLNRMLDIFSRVYPGWAKRFSDNERNKMNEWNISNKDVNEFMKLDVTPSTRMGKYYSNTKLTEKNLYKRFEDMAKTIHIANKFAHEFEMMVKQEIIDYVVKNKKGRPELESLLQDLKDPNKNVIKDFIINYENFGIFIPENANYATREYIKNQINFLSTNSEKSRDNAQKNRNAIRKHAENGFVDKNGKSVDYAKDEKRLVNIESFLAEYNLNLSDLNELYSDDFLYNASRAYNVSMGIKDAYIQIVGRFVKENKLKDISYGICRSLVCYDIPGYGHFSVHYRKDKTDVTEYPRYKFDFSEKEARREPIILIPQMNEKYRKKIEEFSNDDSLDKEYGIDKCSTEKAKKLLRIAKGISDYYIDGKSEIITRSLRHQLAVTAGLPRKVIELLYDADKNYQDETDRKNYFKAELVKLVPEIDEFCKKPLDKMRKVDKVKRVKKINTDKIIVSNNEIKNLPKIKRTVRIAENLNEQLVKQRKSSKKNIKSKNNKGNNNQRQNKNRDKGSIGVTLGEKLALVLPETPSSKKATKDGDER